MPGTTVRNGFALLLLCGAAIVGWYQWPERPEAWTAADIEILRSLSIESLGPVPPDPTNAVADNPAAAAFGHRLFFDRRLSGNGSISCAHCHQPELRFTDGMQKAVAIGMSRRNTPSLIGAAYSPWSYWDGRKDSLWSQALSPLEDPAEHGSNRADVVRLVSEDADYAARYKRLFGSLPDPEEPAAVDRAFANIGKALAAYERQLLPAPTRFDAYVEAVVAGADERQRALFTKSEILGLQLFIGEANCTQCHNGPMLTNHEFHNTGLLSFPGEVPDKGRVVGIRQALADPFNCLGIFSDGSKDDCAELEFARTGPELIGAFRTPSLRNLGRTAPYMHKGQLETLRDVLQHYNEAPAAMIGHNEAKPLGLRRRELRQLEAFLETLDAPPATPERLLRPPD